ncbi:MAG: hypothetical protein P4L49_19310 [Desulfosporosinus sp.]|nr:hypothetical protein [Desulfosporosinus sp.]
MGAPDSYILSGTNNDGYKAMGDAVALPVASFIGKSFLTKLAEVIYDEQRNQPIERIHHRPWRAVNPEMQNEYPRRLPSCNHYYL